MDAELLSEGELDERLRMGDTANRAALDDEGVVAALVAVRYAVVAGALPGPRSSRSEALPRHRRRWVTAGVAAAAVAVASLVGVETLTGGAGSAGLPLAVPPAAAAVLNKVAAAASGQAVPAAGQWDYSETLSQQTQPATAAGSTIEYTLTSTIQTWTKANGAVRVREVNDGVSFPTKRDQATFLANEPAFKKLVDGLTDKGDRVRDDFSSAADERSVGFRKQVWEADPPSDPRTLLTEISQWTRKNGRLDVIRGFSISAQRRASAFFEVFDILKSSTSARLRATAYRALSYLPDTKVLGTRKDQLGRPGVAISFNGDPQANFTLIVSARTGELLEDSETLLKGGAGQNLPTSAWQDRFLVLRRGIVASSTSLPEGGSQPYHPN